MEVAGLVVGVAGLAGLFSTCLDALDKTQQYRNSATDMHHLETQFQAETLRFQQWGRDIGLKRGETLKEGHHKALEEEDTRKTIQEILQIIYTLCQPGGEGSTRLNRSLGQHVSSSSRKQRVAWALWGKGKREEEVKLFKDLVQNLYNLVPPGLPVRDATAEQASKATLADHLNKAHLLDEVRQFIARRDSERKVELRQHLQSWLLGSYSTNNIYHEAIQKRLHGTCNWLTGRPEFQSWISENTESSLLWINGPAGFGKTVLCARVVQYLTETLSTPVAHFFFSSDFESQAEPFVVIRSWIYQLILQDEGIFDLVYDAWLELVDKRAANHVIEKLFEDIVSSAPNCVLVLDGIDECKSLDELEHTPFEVMKKATSKYGVRILIVSRNEPDIRHALEEDDGVQCFNEYKITTQDVRQDTESYSRSIVDKKLSNKAEDIKNDVTQRMAARCDGQFLWLKMQGDSLRRGMNRVQLQRAINNTPSGLTHIYERNWQSISSYEPPEMNRAYSLLRWTAFSVRPLTVGEITEAVLIEDDSIEVPIEELPDAFDDDYINSEILDLCGSLIEVRQPQQDAPNQNMTVHVTHFSVRQYLLQKAWGTAQVLGANGRLQASNEVLENTLLAKRCLQYIQFSGMWSEVKRGIEFSRMGSYVKHSSTKLPGQQFREYASDAWFTHVKSGSQEIIAHTVNAFLGPDSDSLRGWIAWIDQEMIDQEAYDKGSGTLHRKLVHNVNSLCYATWMGLQFSVIHLLESKDYDIDGHDWIGRSPLAISCRLGHTGIARILLDAGASVTTKDIEHQTPLHTALRHGHKDIARMLVKHGADCNAQNPDGWTPLGAASKSGDIVLARTMIEIGADLNALSGDGWTPILLATDSGHIEIVRLLLGKGADLNLTNQHRWAPALAATLNGYLDILKLLVKNGANINNPSSSGRSLVNAATENGYGSVLRFLLDQEDDIPRSNLKGWAPLHIAARDGRTDIIQFLLDKGADISVRNHDGHTPLSMAARRGRLSAARVLVSSGASVDVKDNAGCTPLFRAVFGGYFDIANHLVEQGACPHIKVGPGWTQLHVAAQCGRLDVVKYIFENWNELYVQDDRLLMPLHYASLLGYVEVAQYLASQGVDVNAKDVDSETPLHKASKGGHFEVVKVLVEKGASVNVQCNQYYTPLSLTIRRGQLKIVKFFLDNGFHPHLLNDERCPSPPLFMASKRGILDIAEYLLNNGAVVNIRGTKGDTSTIAAARGGHTKLLQLLINKGADIEAANLDGWTALEAASNCGENKIAQLLIDHGTKLHTRSSMDINIKTSMAIGNNQEDVAKLLLEKMAGVSHHTLHSAVSAKDLNLVQQLVEKGADINLKDENQLTALMLASHHGYVEIILYLIDQGADINTCSSETKVTALLIAVKAGWRNVVRLLVEKGADVSAADHSGWTVLHFACERNYLTLARFLIAHGADPLARTTAGSTTLGIAAIGSNPGFVDLLVGCGVCVADGDAGGLTPLHNAAGTNKELEFVRQLLEKRADPNVKANNGTQPMFYAAFTNYLPKLRLLHEYGASIESRDDDGSTPLHAAAQEGHHPIVQWLLENGADVSASDEKRRTALHIASGSGHLVTMRVLINRGANLDAPDHEGVTPLYFAAGPHRHRLTLVDALLRAGADPMVAADDGSTPLHQCAAWDKGSSLKLLLDHGADLHSEDLSGLTALHMASAIGNLDGARFLCEEGSSLTHATKTGQTPLLVAASHGQIAIVTLFMGRGADIHTRDNGGYGCLHFSARAHYNVTKLFLHLGLSVNTRANNDDTPLHVASYGGHLDIVKLLISKGADVNATQFYQETPLTVAAANGHSKIVSLLLENGATV
ncbi:unnamed protein product [Clonostachys rhizophaga]|uniref:NACHT domain-containing protein n=1 Tax=Clonostachys rhizophaga TaxID=160324 RepID=A0A9N9VQL6_9HYPO|nr:unnamed protein product [Clonostachys rhizophaga]